MNSTLKTILLLCLAVGGIAALQYYSVVFLLRPENTPTVVEEASE